MSDDALARAETRQTLTATTFVEIVDTLVDDFDVIDVLTVLTSRCVELLEAAAAGILLADTTGHLRVIGASTEQIQLLELFQIQNDEGPCLDCFTHGRRRRPRLISTPIAVAAVRRRERRAPGSRPCARPAAARRRRSSAASTCSWPAPVSLSDDRDRARASAGRRRQHRHRPGPGDPRRRDPRGTSAARVEQPDRHRAGQGNDRRTRRRRHGRSVLPAAGVRPEQQPPPHRGRRSARHGDARRRRGRPRPSPPRHHRNEHRAGLTQATVGRRSGCTGVNQLRASE